MAFLVMGPPFVGYEPSLGSGRPGRQGEGVREMQLPGLHLVLDDWEWVTVRGDQVSKLR